MSAADFLLTPTLQRVLSAVYGEPARSFTLNELLERAASGKGSTQRQIDRLVEFGVLLEEPRRGRQRSLRANTEFFLYPELKRIADKSFAIAEPLRAALEPFADAIDEAFVFGSIAKGADSHRSDVDLVVVGTASLSRLRDAMLGVETRLGRPIHLSLYSPTEWELLRRNDAVVSQIASGSIIQLILHAPPASA